MPGIRPGPKTIAAAIVAGEAVLERSLGRGLGASPDARYLPLLLAVGFFGEPVLTRDGFEAATRVASEILRRHYCTRVTDDAPPVILLAAAASAELEPMRTIVSHPDVSRGLKCNLLRYLATSLRHALATGSDKVWETLERLAKAKEVLEMHDDGRLERALANALPGYVQLLGARLERRGRAYVLAAHGAEKEASIDDIVEAVVQGRGPEHVAGELAEDLAEELGYGAYEGMLFRLRDGMVEVLYPERMLLTPEEFIENAPCKLIAMDKLLALGLREPPFPRVLEAGRLRIVVGEYASYGFAVYAEVGGDTKYLGEVLTRDDLAELLVREYVSGGGEDYLGILGKMGRKCLEGPARVLRRLHEGGIGYSAVRASGCTLVLRTAEGDVIVSGDNRFPATARPRDAEIEFAGGIRARLDKAPWLLLAYGVPARLVLRGGEGRFSSLLGRILSVLGIPERAGVDSENNVLEYEEAVIAV